MVGFILSIILAKSVQSLSAESVKAQWLECGLSLEGPDMGINICDQCK